MAHTPNRRSLVKGAAWAAPVIAASAIVPSYAASTSNGGGGGNVDPTPQPTPPSQCKQGAWRTGAHIIFTDPDYSNTNYFDKVNYNTTPNGEAEMQHWYNANSKKLYWRLHLGFPDGAEAGAKITLPFDASWTNPSTPTQGGLAPFLQFAPKKPELYSTDLGGAAIANTGSAFTLTYTSAIPAGAAGVIIFTADPVGGESAVRAGQTYTATADIVFTPASC